MAFCPSCGAAAEGRFCQKCGSALDAGAVPPNPPPVAGNPGLTDNAAGALCYLLGLITGIVFLVLAPYNQSKAVRFNAFQSIFLSLAWVVCAIALSILARILFGIPALGWVLYSLLNFALMIGGLVLWLFLMFKTYNGAKVVLPVIGPLAEQQA